MFDKKEYNKKYREAHKEEIKEYDKKYRKSEKRKKYIKMYHQKNRERIDEYNKKWNKNNPEKYKNIQKRKNRKYNKKHPIRMKARRLARINNMKSSDCSWCNGYENLHFHHTNYEENLGFTLCLRCHRLLHKGMMLG